MANFACHQKAEPSGKVIAVAAPGVAGLVWADFGGCTQPLSREKRIAPGADVDPK